MRKSACMMSLAVVLALASFAQAQSFLPSLGSNASSKAAISQGTGLSSLLGKTLSVRPVTSALLNFRPSIPFSFPNLLPSNANSTRETMTTRFPTLMPSPPFKR